VGFIKNYQQLAIDDRREVVLELVEAAIASIQPEEVFRNNFSIEGETLKIKGRDFNLSPYKNIYLLGFGKGSAGNCAIIERLLGGRLTAGWDVDVADTRFSKVEYTRGTHPVVSQTNVNFTKKVVEKIETLGKDDLVLMVTCGGGSALLELPTIPLGELMRIDEALLKDDANIHDMNVVRKHLSKVKGGGLAEIIYPAKIVNLIFSDVPGNDLTTIASGPTVPDPTRQQDAWDVYTRYKLPEKVPISQESFTKTENDPKIFENVDNILFLSNDTALEAMQRRAKELGHKANILTNKFQSEANIAGQQLIDAASPGSILLAGGETTVDVKGKGIGGRNQELVLCALGSLRKGDVIVSFDSDGWDNSEAAGAVGDTETARKAKEVGLNIQKFLDDNNSFAFFEAVGDAILTGRLPSNVSDLMVVYKN